jgi:uncharacterized phage protein (TIGR01671 family)
MQREIKFRAWDKKQKAFINGFNMVGFSTGQGAPKRKLQRFSSYWDEEEVELMQYTGLKDKNGKEIYDGDILQVETAWYKAKITPTQGEDETDAIFGYRRNGITYWTVEHKIFTSRVGFMIYGIDRRFHKVLTPNMIYNNKAEVIGNIYENPELLTQSPTNN